MVDYYYFIERLKEFQIISKTNENTKQNNITRAFISIIFNIKKKITNYLNTIINYILFNFSILR